MSAIEAEEHYNYSENRRQFNWHSGYGQREEQNWDSHPRNQKKWRKAQIAWKEFRCWEVEITKKNKERWKHIIPLFFMQNT